MQSDTHVAGAVAIQSGVLLSAGIDNPDLIAGSLVIAGGGALVPDFDHAGSYISNEYPLFGWIGYFFKHRGMSHTLFFWIVMSLGLYTGYWFGIQKEWWAFREVAFPAIAVFVLGGMSHLLLDSMTPSGVPWLGPFSWNRYSMDVFKTGSIWEWLFKILLFCLVILALSGLGVIDLFKLIGN